MHKVLIYNASIITGESIKIGSIEISDKKISNIWYDDIRYEYSKSNPEVKIIDASGKYVMAGGIDAHVHFREPGLTSKADIASESTAAALGGVTSFVDMPNTNPACINGDRLSEKAGWAGTASYINYGFHLGASNDNFDEITRLKESPTVAAIKVFMGSSTGNMLVNKNQTLENLFKIKEKPIFVHCEDESIINANLKAAIAEFGDDIPISEHENIRSRKACIMSSIKALEKAIKYGTRLHLLHISTAEEVEMVRAAKQQNSNIFAETSANYLWFTNEDYGRMGTRLKCNPSVKTQRDRDALRKGLAEGIIDSIGTDHAPHLLEEKKTIYTKAPSGIPSIQESLGVLWKVFEDEEIDLSILAKVFSENIAKALKVKDRGSIEVGKYADLIIINKKDKLVQAENLAYKCGWSPYEGLTLPIRIETVFLNGEIIVSDETKTEVRVGMALKFE